MYLKFPSNVVLSDLKLSEHLAVNDKSANSSAVPKSQCYCHNNNRCNLLLRALAVGGH
jgi:hypothetical protein